MPRGGTQSSCWSSRKMPLVPLPRAVQSVTASRSTGPQPPTPIPMPAPPIFSPGSCRPQRSVSTPSTTVSWRKSQPNPVAAVSWIQRSLNRPRSTYWRPSPLARTSYSSVRTREPSISKRAKVTSAMWFSGPAPCCAVVNQASGTGRSEAPGLARTKQVAPRPAPTSETPLRQRTGRSRTRYRPAGTRTVRGRPSAAVASPSASTSSCRAGPSSAVPSPARPYAWASAVNGAVMALLLPPTAVGDEGGGLGAGATPWGPGTSPWPASITPPRRRARSTWGPLGEAREIVRRIPTEISRGYGALSPIWGYIIRT